MDGIPGLFPGTITPIPEPDDEGIPVENTPCQDTIRNVYGGSNTVKTLNRRMLKK
jgi:hypothetical protein